MRNSQDSLDKYRLIAACVLGGDIELAHFLWPTDFTNKCRIIFYCQKYEVNVRFFGSITIFRLLNLLIELGFWLWLTDFTKRYRIMIYWKIKRMISRTMDIFAEPNTLLKSNFESWFTGHFCIVPSYAQNNWLFLEWR